MHPSAIVAPTATIGAGVSIGANCVIEAGVANRGRQHHPRRQLTWAATAGWGGLPSLPERDHPGGVTIGDRVIIHSGAVIGSDGFGFVRDGEVYRKIPQIGDVVIEDDVEIGANVTIDRATTGTTFVGRGTKIDNLVQIGHNVAIGENCILVAQVGIGGSTQLGKGVTLAGQSGLVGHIKIGDGATVGAQAGVTKSMPAGMTVSGYPAREHGQANKILASLQRLPELMKKVADLGQRVKKLEEKVKG